MRAEVLRVTDGDSFVVIVPSGDQERVRAIGIDAPEASDNARLRRQTEKDKDRAAVIEMGHAASAHADSLLEKGAAVHLVFDPANAATRHRDRYGRLLAYVYILDASGRRGTFFNERMLSDGYARLMSGFPYDERMRTRFRAAEEDARREARGLWSEPDPPFDQR